MIAFKEMVAKFTNDMMLRNSSILDSLTDKRSRKLFIKANTSIPSGAAVECVFSLGKNVMRPKRSRLTDNHLEMLLFLKGNKM